MPKPQSTNHRNRNRIEPAVREALVNERKKHTFITKRKTDGVIGEKRVTYESGATRCAGVAGDSGDFPLRYDLLLDNVTALKRVARTFGEGSLKYPARNWMKGMPESALLNHALAHIVMHRKGDTSEDHLAHATWNLMTLMHMQDQMPEQLDVTGPLTSRAD